MTSSAAVMQISASPASWLLLAAEIDSRRTLEQRLLKLQVGNVFLVVNDRLQLIGQMQFQAPRQIGARIEDEHFRIFPILEALDVSELGMLDRGPLRAGLDHPGCLASEFQRADEFALDDRVAEDP